MMISSNARRPTSENITNKEGITTY